MVKRCFVLLVLLVLYVAVPAQEGCAKFSLPFDFEILLSGNFGELRSNHFHAGLDFKTQGVEGKPIKAVADGYIARAKVTPGGYGRALYVVHDNGYMTVYGHLKSFPPAIDAAVRSRQYENESFAVDIDFAPGEHPVKEGEEFALAGNSGYSFGPHLHFEVRSLCGERLYNPMQFYCHRIKDTLPPVISAVALYPHSGQGVVNGGSQPVVRRVKERAVADTLQAWGRVGFAVKAIDYMNGTRNKYGVYAYELYIDDSLHFSSRADSFTFAENRLINAWADYEKLAAGEGWFLRSFLLANNPLGMLSAAEGNGWVYICQERVYKVEYRLRDYHNNTVSHTIYIQGRAADIAAPAVRGHHLRWYLANKVQGNGFSLEIPRAALFDDAWVEARDSVTAAGAPVCLLGNERVPLWHAAKLTMDIPQKMLPFAGKCYIERLTSKGGSAVGGVVKGGSVTADISQLDSYAIAVDTVAPVLKPVGEKLWARNGKIVFALADKGSGVESCKGTIDGEFVLFEYSSKNGRLVCNLHREGVKRGTHTLKVVALDKVGNEKVYEKQIKY